MLCLYLSWTFFGGECLISFIDKWIKNNDYKVGDDPVQLDDFNTIFGEKTYKYVVFPLLVIVSLVSLWIIFSRNQHHIPIAWTIGILVMVMLYLVMLRVKNKIAFNVFNEVFKIYLVVMLTIYTQALRKN
jgi:hypothetical protein